MNKLLLPAALLIIFIGCLSHSLPSYSAENKFIIFCYHDIQDDPAQQRVGDAVTLSSRQLILQFDWLKAHGYTAISLNDIRAAEKGQQPLPEKAVLLTFDDGYLSTYTRVFPILEAYNYPAVVGLVTEWMEAPVDGSFQYGQTSIARKNLMSWDQVNEMIASGLVEIASHSHDLHHGHRASPQGNLLPAATNRIYNENNNMYENDGQYNERIRSDLQTSMDIIKRHTGKSPRAIIWPYGSYNRPAVTIAKTLGMPISMSLEDGHNTLADLPNLKRFFIGNDATLSDIVRNTHEQQWHIPQRIVHIDIDMIYDDDPEQQDRNLGELVRRIAKLDINTVYLQAYADPDGDGVADALYFPNRNLPVRRDLFGQVSNTLRSRLRVKVYAWLPVLAFKPAANHPVAGRTVVPDRFIGTDNSYYRLSPFDNQVRKFISEIYEDLAKYTAFDGILFHDDAVLSDFEDDSQAAHTVYKNAWSMPASIKEIQADPVIFNRWSMLKTQWLIDFTSRLSERVREYRPGIKTARNLYAQVILNPKSEEWYAQSLSSFLDNYDYTAVMAMPFMENANNPEAWIETLVKRVKAIPGSQNKTVFELQSVDWNTNSPVADEALVRQTKQLQHMGILNYGYYPDNFISGHPTINALYPIMSLRTYPYDKPEQVH